MEILKLFMRMLVQVIVFLFSMFMLSSCSNGWSVGDFEPSPRDSMYAYIEIIDQDSTSHFYADQIRLDSDNWCFTHNQWEAIREDK